MTIDPTKSSVPQTATPTSKESFSGCFFEVLQEGARIERTPCLEYCKWVWTKQSGLDLSQMTEQFRVTCESHCDTTKALIDAGQRL